MKRALLLLALAACSRSPRPPSCEQVCEHASDLAEAQLEQTLQRISDHSDSSTADALRARAADARAAERTRCLERCDAGELDRACILGASSLEAAEKCPPKQPR